MSKNKRRLLVPVIPTHDHGSSDDSALSSARVEAEVRRRVAAGEVGSYPIVENPCSTTTQATYEVLRDLGVPDWLASMQATHHTPAFGGTEHNFLQGRDNNQEFDKMPDDMRRKYLRQAKKAGVNPRGKVYISGLAKEPCDPNAWVSSQHEADAKIKHNGWSKFKD